MQPVNDSAPARGRPPARVTGFVRSVGLWAVASLGHDRIQASLAPEGLPLG